MILADKILNLRKSLDLSQEELANKLNVSRQSISKWESATSIPDMNRIIQLSELFGVSVDYLVKESRTDASEATLQMDKPNHLLDLADVDAYLQANHSYGRWVGSSVAICIASPIGLLMSLALIEKGMSSNDKATLAAGVASMMILLALGAGLAIYASLRNKLNRKLEESEFELAFGTEEILKERQRKFEVRTALLFALSIIGVILSVLPVTFVSIQDFPDDVIISMAAVMLAMLAPTLLWIIRFSLEKRAYAFLLSEGDFEPKKRKRTRFFKQILTYAFLIALFVKFILSIIS